MLIFLSKPKLILTSALASRTLSSHPAKRECDVGESEVQRAMCVKAPIVLRVWVHTRGKTSPGI